MKINQDVVNYLKWLIFNAFFNESSFKGRFDCNSSGEISLVHSWGSGTSQGSKLFQKDILSKPYKFGEYKTHELIL